jgi:hypothetical protein
MFFVPKFNTQYRGPIKTLMKAVVTINDISQVVTAPSGVEEAGLQV